MSEGGDSNCRADLNAAIKTVTVLKNKIRSFQNGADKSILQRQMEASRQREEGNRRKRELIEMRAEELKHYSETLEAEVDARARAMKTIIDNVAFGFLLVGSDHCVQDGFTRSCTRLFGKEVEVGVHVCQLFSIVSNRVRQSFDLALEQIFEDILPEKAVIAQMPRRFPLADGRILAVEPRAIRAASPEVSSVLFTVSDATAFEAARRESRKNGVLVELLRQKSAFANFMGDTASDLAIARNAFRQGSTVVVRRIVHTLKGTAASYGLDDQVALLHSIEERDIVDDAALNEIEASLKGFLDKNRHVLDIDYADVARVPFELSESDVMRLRSLALRDNPGPALRRWTAKVLRHPVRVAIGPMPEFSRRLAERLDKEVYFQFTGGEIMVDPAVMGPVLRSVVHLVRNAVDHAIESIEERGGKPEKGRIQLTVTETDTDYSICVEDDGRGIAVEALAAKAVETARISAERAKRMSDEQKRELVFLDYISTAIETTDVSGRGLGMSAVQAAVRGAGGTIEVESEIGQGTRFTLKVPKPISLRRDSSPPSGCLSVSPPEGE